MKIQSHSAFWQRIHRAAKNKNFPLRVMFELTYRCNFNCKHCYIPKSYRNRGELTTQEVFLVLDELKDIGCFYLGFTGGEPFVRKDIMEILRYAGRKGFEVIVYTNGSLLNEKIIKELATLRLNKVDITIPAMSKAAFESISGVSGSRDKVFNAIKGLHKRKVSLGFKSCVLKENESEIKDIQDFAASLGASHRLDDMLNPRLNGSAGPYRHRGKRDPLRPHNRFDMDTCGVKRTTAATNLFSCGVGKSQAAVTPQGKLKLCLMIDSPRFRILREGGMRADLKAAWAQVKKFVSAIKPDKNYKCDTCGSQDYCKWCPAQSWLYNKTFTSCIHERNPVRKV